MTATVDLVEVAPRDGFQPIGPWIPTETKIATVRRLAAAGLRRIEIGSFVSASAIPQLRDAAALVEAAAAIPGLRPQVLVPTAKRAREAVAAGARFLVYVLSASEAHNWSNVRRPVAESAEDYARMLDALPADVAVRINLATAFDCPFDGRMAVPPVLDLIGRLAALRPDVEICLCDTTGRATPDHVAQLASAAAARCPDVAAWAYHAHDTYGLGLATTYAAYQAGIRVFDAAAGGLGGCPFAPGATGNVATEDVVWMFERMGIPTGVALDALLPIAADVAALPGASAGGRARAALASRGACPVPEAAGAAAKAQA
ncbi:hydroxymethylglutaryl-CoA lyase [Paracraurococcus ruber]|uniref:Hydroxymethylglutaryl-CoA lyase n=1 Tax=Paracraurococcus ruber TaxID=77675 RepID=A0ABS1D379_9PROT|nr:hydroxymethylglutaryl-CoA lyase [Paracraurococcus ruber]MBK1660895.1 hydroxymethylglutaryl-CoA lyase [Paracraurococcus ruber]TDG26958.1 hydroxymethylglutaryl-CoA lyase [Paracraurococcus ruber]